MMIQQQEIQYDLGGSPPSAPKPKPQPAPPPPPPPKDPGDKEGRTKDKDKIRRGGRRGSPIGLNDDSTLLGS